MLDIHPAPYSQLGPLIRDGRIRADVVMLQVSPPNARGEYSLGLAAEYLVPALESARAIVAEVNDQVPWTHTEPLLRKKDFALIVESSRPAGLPCPTAHREIETAIARHAAPFIPEGAALECGIGNLPERGAAARCGSGAACASTPARSATAVVELQTQGSSAASRRRRA